MRAPLAEERRGRRTAYYLTGSAKNTCNFAIVLHLEVRGVTDAGAVLAMPQISPVVLMPDEELPLFHSLGQYRHGEIAGLIVAPRCPDGSAGSEASLPPPLCGSAD